MERLGSSSYLVGGSVTQTPESRKFCLYLQDRADVALLGKLLAILQSKGEEECDQQQVADVLQVWQPVVREGLHSLKVMGVGGFAERVIARCGTLWAKGSCKFRPQARLLPGQGYKVTEEESSEPLPRSPLQLPLHSHHQPALLLLPPPPQMGGSLFLLQCPSSNAYQTNLTSCSP